MMLPRLDLRCSVLSGRRDQTRSLILLDETRFFFRGALGKVDRRSGGAWVVYVALEAPMDVKLGASPWQSARLVVTRPHEVHSVRGHGAQVAQFAIEADDVDTGSLPEWAGGATGVIDDPQRHARLWAACTRISAADAAAPLAPHLDALLLGRTLPRRHLDERIARVIASLAARPGDRHSADDSAALAGLSVSRFLHLFSQELGVPYRHFRIWKRARGMLALVECDCNLTELAMESGYSDSSHFSKSIRDTFGMTPKELVAATRRLLDLRPAPAAG